MEGNIFYSKYAPRPRLYSSLEKMPRIRSTSETASILVDIPENMKGAKIRELTELLEESLNESLSAPIEYYESKLFDLCRTFYKKLDPSTFSLTSFCKLYPLLKIIELESQNRIKWTDEMNKILLQNSDAMREYNFVNKFIGFINDIAIKWGIIEYYNYRFRFDQRLEYLKFLDLNAVFKKIINPEIIWLSFNTELYPLSVILTENIKQAAENVRTSFKNIISVFLKSNRLNIESQESIQGYLARKNQTLITDFNFVRSENKLIPSYQKLSHGFCLLFCKDKSIYQLNSAVKEFEKAYRIFESGFMISLVDMIKSELVMNLRC